MALGAEMARPFPAGVGGDEEEASAPARAATVFLAVESDRAVDSVIWSDEKQMKRELVAWAKAVAASMEATKNASSSFTAPRHRLRGRPW
ncbi:unnamed protein product [Urochloa decumbens]|uniref:Uncharacterized protein n=1 Tax=Urochloa decumbens TaxID=240449 RepID=A0ABC9E739_9POAL